MMASRSSASPDATCDASLRSWVESANAADTDFPIQNLPFGVFRRQPDGRARIGVAIGDQIVDLRGLADAGALNVDAKMVDACRCETLNALMACGRAEATVLRRSLSGLLREDAKEPAVVERHLISQHDVEMLLPAAIGDYTDFYASIEHATRVGALFRPDRPLLPNYKHVPIGYHGRASSIVVSGTDVRRPHGQRLEGEVPLFAPTASMDYEVEVGFFVGRGNALGVPIGIDDAREHLFGCCLLNDWSARDIQSWEYQPLGPFLGKSFATSISPWVVTVDALAPFRRCARQRDADDPAVLPYLSSRDDYQSGAFDIQVEASIQTTAMRDAGIPPVSLSRSEARSLYWTPAQLLTHHASNGCNLRPGDLLGTGTISGEDARACLLELTERGATPVHLLNGEQRAFLRDGDEVILNGYCVGEGARRIGFGECRGVVLPAIS